MYQIKQLFEEGFVLVDVETTGLPNSSKVGIVEIAILDHNGNVLKNQLVNPERPIPTAASRIHGIADFDVAAAPTFGDIYDELEAIFAVGNVVAYNHTFEQDVFAAVCKRYTKPPFSVTWHCAMRGYSEYKGERKWFKLGAACHREGIVVKNAHRALGDCIMTLALLRKMAGIEV